VLLTVPPSLALTAAASALRTGGVFGFTKATFTGPSAMENQSVTAWIDQLSDGNQQAAEQLWEHISLRLQEFARKKLDPQTRRHYDEQDAANSAFHSLCRGLADFRIKAESRDAFWGLLVVITSRKISAQRRSLNRQNRGGAPQSRRVPGTGLGLLPRRVDAANDYGVPPL